MARAARRGAADEGESYFMSMTDMMVGLLLIFIILLAYFALHLQTKTAELTSANRTRAKILHDLQQSLRNRGLQVEIDAGTGVLRLPDEILFDKGQWQLTDSGRAAVSKVAGAMVEILPCYTASELCRGERSAHRIDAVFVEGHTDSDAMLGGMDNYGLSVRRAETTFKMLRHDQPRLETLRNKPASAEDSAPILSLSGYGPDRPADRRDTEDAKKRNRRIDLRFLMATPGAGPDANALRRSR